MSGLLALSRGIDWINETVGKLVYWLVLVVVIISAGNASLRYGFDLSSNAWLEIQWYLFSAIFLLAAGYTLKRNEHIRIDIIYLMYSRRRQVWVDVIGTVLFLFPMLLVVGYFSLDWVWKSYADSETSANAGGLLRWPVKILLPIGFALLLLQGISELIKRIAFLAGKGPDPEPYRGEEIDLSIVKVEK